METTIRVLIIGLILTNVFCEDTPECVDKSSGCDSLKQQGHCNNSSSYFPFMMDYCMRSCKLCSTEIPVEGTMVVVSDRDTVIFKINGDTGDVTYSVSGHVSSKPPFFVRSDCSSTTSGNKGYIVYGHNVAMFDIQTQLYTSMPITVKSHPQQPAVFVKDSNLYCVAGNFGASGSDVGKLEYISLAETTQLKTWATMDNLSNTDLAYSLGATGGGALIGDTIYIAGGLQNDGRSKDTMLSWKFGDPYFRVLDNMNYPRSSHCTVACQGSVWVLGGWSSYGITTSVERFSPSRNRWNTETHLQWRMQSMGCACYNSWIIVVGGQFDDWTSSSAIFLYNIESNVWSVSETLLPRPMKGPAVMMFK